MNITGTSGVTITPTTFNTSKAATGQAPYNTVQSTNQLPLSLAYTGNWTSNYYKLVAYDSSANILLETPPYEGTSKPIIFVPPITSANVGTGEYVTITIFGGETSSAINTAINSIRIDTSALTLEAAPLPVEGLNVTLTSPASGISISPSTVANNGTLNISGNWGTVSGLTANNPIGLDFETNFSVIDNWNYVDGADYIDFTYFDHWGVSIGINQGIVSANMSLEFTQLADAIRGSYPSKITLDHYAWNSSTEEHERAHRLEITLDYSNLTYPNQTGIYDGSVSILNNSVNNFEFDGELQYNVSSQKYELSFCMATLGTNLPNYNYIIYDKNGQDLTGHFSGFYYVFNNFTSALQATGPFVLKTQAVNEQAQWVDVCPPITLDVSQITFAPVPPNFAGVETGDLGYTMFEMSTNYSTYYAFDPGNEFEASALNYIGSTTYDGHTKYEYEATPDFVNACHVKYLDSSLTWYACRNVINDNGIWLFTRTPVINNATATSGIYEYGGPLPSVMSGAGFPCNAFYCIWNAQPSTLGNYHYTFIGSQTPPSLLDISNAGTLVFATKGDSTSIPSTPIEFKLYNSDASDYILISIDMSNITASQYS